MRSILTTLAAATLIATASPTLAHTPTQAASQNAALGYLREYIYLTPELTNVLSQENMKNPDGLSIEDKQEILEWRDLIGRITKISQLPNCDWGLDKSQGLYLLLPHLSSHRKLVRLIFLDAMIRIKDGDLDGAVENTITIMRMAHHISLSDGFVITRLVGVSELALAEALLEKIPSIQLTASHRESLAKTLALFDEEDPFGVRVSMMAEISSISIWLRASVAGKTQSELEAFIDDLLENVYYNTSPTIEERQALIDPTSLMSFIDLYAALQGQINIRWKSQNPTEQLQELDRMVRQGDFGPLAKYLASEVGRMYTYKQRHEKIRAHIAQLINE
jgi:hypothetical protein